jgi:RND family efflux transporter MFP subunit
MKFGEYMSRLGILSAIGLLTGSLAAAEEFDCLIRPYQTLEIRSATGGLIDRILVDQGDTVQKGQVLAVLESSTEQSVADLAKFRAQMSGPLITAETRAQHTAQRLTRKEQLHKKGFTTSEERDQALAEQKVAEAELAEAKENRQLAHYEYRRAMAQLNLKQIKSPILGVVTERLSNPGEVAELGVGQKPMLKIVQLDPLRVEVILPIRLYGQIKAGSQAEIVPEAPIAGRYSATVQTVDKVVDAASATFAVRLELRNAQHKLPAGIRCNATFADLANGKAAK